jgi:dihydrofolate reductase
MIEMIWAMDKNNLIGKDNKIPWHVKEDLLYYKEKTKGKDVLMGYNTYLSLKGYYKDKPLPYGKVYVASFCDIDDPNIILVKDLLSFIKNYKDDLMIVGGKSIYLSLIDYADTLYISYIKGDYEGDTYMKPLDLSKFKKEILKETDKVIYTVYRRC